MACKMGWVMIGGVAVVVFTTYERHRYYTVKIMINRNGNIPNDPTTTPNSPPWRQGHAADCGSHEEARTRAFKWVKTYLAQRVQNKK